MLTNFNQICSFSLASTRRRDCSHTPLLLSASVPSLLLAIRECSGVSRRYWFHSPSFGNQLHILVHNRFHLQLLHSTLPLPMVDALQLYFCCGTRRWCRVIPDCDIFHTTGMGNQWRHVQLVGQYVSFFFSFHQGRHCLIFKFSVWQNTADANSVPLKPLPSSGIIGPSKWS